MVFFDGIGRTVEVRGLRQRYGGSWGRVLRQGKLVGRLGEDGWMIVNVKDYHPSYEHL